MSIPLMIESDQEKTWSWAHQAVTKIVKTWRFGGEKQAVFRWNKTVKMGFLSTQLSRTKLQIQSIFL